MPIVATCPNCVSRFRLPDSAAVRQLVRLRCQRCDEVFPAFGQNGDSLPRILIAHPEGGVRLTVAQILAKSGYNYSSCADGKSGLKLLREREHTGVLVDCALPNMFAFELIDRLRKDEQLRELKIILLSSVYNKTAYKRRPTSLYGADDYIEIHHLPDRLIEKFQTLLAHRHPESECHNPTPSEQISMNQRLKDAEVHDSGGGPEPGTADQARRFARMLVADIALYYQEKVDSGVRNGNLRLLLSDQIAEGRRLLAERVPAELLAEEDYFEEALITMERRRRQELTESPVGGGAR